MAQLSSLQSIAGDPAVNYERFFVPAIGAPLARDLVALAKLRQGEHVLDLACGTGVVARLAADEVGDGVVVGVDVNPGMLAVARTASGERTIEWHEAGAEGLPLGEGSFDVAFCQLALQFFSDRAGALREVRRVLRPGGRVVINVPGPTPALFAVLEEALRRHVGPNAAAFVAAVFSLHDTNELCALMTREGLGEPQARTETKTLELPAPEDFLWQYLYSTPLAGPAGTLDEQGRAALQHDVVTGWSEFVRDGRLVLELGVTSATARA
jgi:SAM-dependent methyltransferase